MKQIITIFLSLLILLSGLASSHALPQKCATAMRGRIESAFTPRPPLPRRASWRNIAPVPTSGANIYTTEYVRILWGDDYPKADPDWADSDATGLPLWVEVAAEAMEEAFLAFSELGFDAPYGSDKYYLDVYIADTGVEVDGDAIKIEDNIYAYTMIDNDYRVAYFIFNKDFSAHTDAELEVLKVTVAHELFHAIQRTYYPWDDEVIIPDRIWQRDGWWTEASAAWMEEIIYPDVNDYVKYVNDFLARPEESLTSMDGLREYGASVFISYLWDNFGEELFVQDSMQRFMDLGVEGAMDSVLVESGYPAFPETVGHFWVSAAAPAGKWRDGSLFKPAKLILSAAAFPFKLDLIGNASPARYGANIVKFPNRGGPVNVELSEANPEESWLVGFLRHSDRALPVVKISSGDGRPIVFETESSAYAYMAIVNGASSQKFRPYKASMFINGQAASPVDSVDDEERDKHGREDNGKFINGIQADNKSITFSSDCFIHSLNSL